MGSKYTCQMKNKQKTEPHDYALAKHTIALKTREFMILY